MKYKIKRVGDFPEHVKGCCYAITDNGHTMLPEDVVRRLNDANKILKENSTSTNTESVPCQHENNIYIEKNEKACHLCLDCMSVYWHNTRS